jgi:hypothetical protein
MNRGKSKIAEIETADIEESLLTFLQFISKIQLRGFSIVGLKSGLKKSDLTHSLSGSQFPFLVQCDNFAARLGSGEQLNHGLRMPREDTFFTARLKIQSQSQIFRYGRSIFSLPHRPNFSGIFDLCLHWVSVVRELNHVETSEHVCPNGSERINFFFPSCVHFLCVLNVFSVGCV